MMNSSDLIRINGTLMTIAILAARVKKAAVEMAEEQMSGCCYWRLGNIKNHVFAICIGWQPGYENEPDDTFASHDGDIGNGYHLAIKLAFQPANSIMQCDFDVDWLMPYDPNTGDVDDTCEAIYADTDYDTLACSLVDRFQDYMVTSLSMDSGFFEKEYTDPNTDTAAIIEFLKSLDANTEKGE